MAPYSRLIHPQPLTGLGPVSTDASTTPAAVITPVPERAAAAILGSMIGLILMLMTILVQTTWTDAVGIADVPPSETAGYAQR